MNVVKPRVVVMLGSTATFHPRPKNKPESLEAKLVHDLCQAEEMIATLHAGASHNIPKKQVQRALITLPTQSHPKSANLKRVASTGCQVMNKAAEVSDVEQLKYVFQKSEISTLPITESIYQPFIYLSRERGHETREFPISEFASLLELILG